VTGAEVLVRSAATLDASVAVTQRVGALLECTRTRREKMQHGLVLARANLSELQRARRLAVGGPSSWSPARRADVASKHIEFHQTGDRTLREELVGAHYGLARRIASRFTGRGESIEDLTQVALLALVKAVDGFDATRGVQFSSYATATISGELKRHFRDKRWGVRVPRSTQEAYLRVRDALDRLTVDLGRSPTVSEVAIAEGITEDQVLEGMEAARVFSMASLDAPLDDDPSQTIPLSSKEPGYGLVDNRLSIAPLIARLPEREQRILRYRFFEDMTQSEIAAELGISQMHVSRLLGRALDRLRHGLAS